MFFVSYKKEKVGPSKAEITFFNFWDVPQYLNNTVALSDIYTVLRRIKRNIGGYLLELIYFKNDNIK
jgi:hypothetical protein